MPSRPKRGMCSYTPRETDLWWGGMASTFFWIDPVEDLIVTLMTQMIPSGAYPIRRELRTLVYSAFTESNL